MNMENLEVLQIYLRGFKDCIETVLYAFEALEKFESNEQKNDCTCDSAKTLEAIKELTNNLRDIFTCMKEDK